MGTPLEVYLEGGSKRVFAGALDWPGWNRAAKTEDAALETLVSYAPRYAAALGALAGGVAAASDIVVVERLDGTATTDFGAPDVAPSSDAEPIDDEGLAWLSAVLERCWSALDETARRWCGAQLRKGPRGGGRDLDAIVAHVTDADRAYLTKLGGRWHKRVDGEVDAQRLRVRMTETLAARARGEPPVQTPRSRLWSPRWFVRRFAWHALDHVWEIEDRAVPAASQPR
ncbi:MAG TPA: hypothetical protein VG452_09340 [Egibacteraceae bacterium]|nr:hypothetical protein [Egibacteraceae bacterium]